jgi:hypothetical protein
VGNAVPGRLRDDRQCCRREVRGLSPVEDRGRRVRRKRPEDDDRQRGCERNEGRSLLHCHQGRSESFRTGTKTAKGGASITKAPKVEGGNMLDVYVMCLFVHIWSQVKP